MIVTCPTCATRHDFPHSLRAPGDVRITCRSCGHRWIEIEDDGIIDIEPIRKSSFRAIDHDAYEPRRQNDEDEVQRLVEASQLAQQRFADKQAARRSAWRQWLIYVGVAAAPLVGLGLFPEKVVSAAPAAIKAYEAVGLGVNLYGLEVRHVQQQHALVKGVRVLTIKGEIANVSDNTRKIPWLRFGLRSAAATEVYSWTLDTASRPLRAGEVTSFITRVASPPDKAVDVQIRFAHEDEIGSNAGS